MNTSFKSALPAVAAFGAAAAAGLLASVLWAPAPGQHTRNRLAARLNSWSRPLANRFSTRRGRQPGARAGTEADLSMHPDHLLAKL